MCDLKTEICYEMIFLDSIQGVNYFRESHFKLPLS
jgi:hypothetical protein